MAGLFACLGVAMSTLACRRCGAPFTGEAGRKYCSQRCGILARVPKRSSPALTTTQKGYGWAHQQARAKALAALVPGSPCVRCGGPMHPGQALDLDHADDRTTYRGLAHRHCNRSAGATKGNRSRGKITGFVGRW